MTLKKKDYCFRLTEIKVHVNTLGVLQLTKP